MIPQIFMNYRKKLINMPWNFFEVWRNMISNVDWLLAEPASELSNICDCQSIQRPKRIFVKRFNALGETDLNTVGQKVVLS